MTSQQREDVEPKYETFYRTFARAIATVVAGPGDPLAKYRHLKLLVSSIWVVMSWMMQSEENARIGGAEQDARRFAYLGEGQAWEEGGVAKSGTNADYIYSLAAYIARTALTHVPKGSDLFLDLGCGWGHRMVDMHLAGLRTRFIGGDRSLHSRDAVLATTSLFPEMDSGWFAFDFVAPNFAPLPDAKRLCIFTCHAIEQVEFLGSTLFDRLLQRYPQAAITGIHFEPITWQIDPSYAPESAYARQHRYNQDLHQVVATHSALRITHAEALVHRAGGDTTSLLVWERT